MNINFSHTIHIRIDQKAMIWLIILLKMFVGAP